MASSQVSPNTTKNHIKRNPTENSIALDDMVDVFQPTFKISITHLLPPNVKVLINKDNIKVNGCGVVTIDRQPGVVNVAFTELVSGKIEIDPVAEEITVILSPRVQDAPHPQ